MPKSVKSIPYDPVPDFNAYGMPNFTKDIETLYNLTNALHNSSGKRPCSIVEVGAWAGRTALTMLNASPTAQIHCFDLWFVNQQGRFPTHECGIPILQGFLENTKEFSFRQIHPHPGDSIFWAANWPKSEKLDLVYLDGDHSLQGVLADIAAWTPHIRPGGILCGHDFRWPEVRNAVDMTGSYRFACEDGTDPNRHMFANPDEWGGIWWREI